MSSTSWRAFCVFSSAAAMSSFSAIAIVLLAVFLRLFRWVDISSCSSVRVFFSVPASCGAFAGV